MACTTAVRHRAGVGVGAHHECNPSVGELLVAEIHLPVIVSVESLIVDARDDADDLSPRRLPAGYRHPKAFADRALAGPQCSRHSLVDDADERRLRPVALGQRPPLQQRDVHRPEILRRDRPHLQVDRLPGRAFQLERQHEVVPGRAAADSPFRRRRRRERRPPDRRSACRARAIRSSLSVLPSRNRHVEAQDVLRAESGIDAASAPRSSARAPRRRRAAEVTGPAAR